jgi:AcrR family transcriptional regulator
MSADERRAHVLSVATAIFAKAGYEGTSTEAVARAAGISQPYLFRLFATKKDLFIALIERDFERVGRAFEQAAQGLRGKDALLAMGTVYGKLLTDRDLLRFQLHAYAACDDEQIRAATRRAFSELWNFVGELSGLSSAELTDFFAHGMLLNVIAALDAAELGDAWVRACLGGGA